MNINLEKKYIIIFIFIIFGINLINNKKYNNIIDNNDLLNKPKKMNLTGCFTHFLGLFLIWLIYSRFCNYNEKMSNETPEQILNTASNKDKIKYYKDKSNNKNLYVFTYITDNNLAKDIIKSAEKNNIKLIILGNNKHFNDSTDKFKELLLKMDEMDNLEILNDETVILFLNAYNTSFLSNINNIYNKFKKKNAKIIFSAEKKPDKRKNKHGSFIVQYDKEIYKYCGSSGFIGYKEYIQDMLEEFEESNFKCNSIDIKDKSVPNTRKCLSLYYFQNPHLVKLDNNQDIWGNLRGENIDNFKIINNRIKNITTNMFPSIIYGTRSGEKIYYKFKEIYKINN